MMNHEGEKTGAEKVYAEPSAARSEASRVLSDARSTDSEKADALWALGRSAYYANQMANAVIYLEAALPLAETPARRTDVLLTLAPALSKNGDPASALALLNPAQAEMSTEQRGQLHNQRGIVLTELGRLPEAVDDLRLALSLLHEAGDRAAEARTLVNLGAAASMMGDQNDAEHWYTLAWEVCTDTGQMVVAAGIEGNLGYVASRRGDFPTALKWYYSARNTFAGFGDVSLLVATLETDHATTLLDIGLNLEAAEAARFALESSRAGANKMLEVQALLLHGEAELRLGRRRVADTSLRAARDSALQLGIQPWVMRADYLLLHLITQSDQEHEDLSSTVRDLVDALEAAGWPWEAMRASVLGADAIAAGGNASDAAKIIRWALGRIQTELADPVDVAYAEALDAHLSGDRERERNSLSRGLSEIDRQRAFVGSAEMHVRLGHRSRALRDLAVGSALGDGDPIAVLTATETSRSRLGPRDMSDDPQIVSLRSSLRDVRVGFAEATLAGSDTQALRQQIEKHEQDILRVQRRTVSPRQPALPIPVPELAQLPISPTHSMLVSYIRHSSELFAVTLSGEGARLCNLGEVETILDLVAVQRSVLRTLALAESAETTKGLAKMIEINEQINSRIVEPLGNIKDQVTVIPALCIAGLSWSGLPSLTEAQLTIAPSIMAWRTGPSQIVIESVGVMSGANLRFADEEVNRLAAIWGEKVAHGKLSASTSDAELLLSQHGLVHIAAHGTFRGDNPFFSAIEFQDGPLTLLDLERLTTVPDMVVLASCDGAASTGVVGSELVGTTATMMGLGVSVMIAPTVIVDDRAAFRFSEDLHQLLKGGRTIGAAMSQAQSNAFDRRTPADISASHAFQLHGNKATQLPIHISRI